MFKMKRIFLATIFLTFSLQSFAKEGLILKFQNQKDKSSVAALIQKHKGKIEAEGEKFILIKSELMNPDSKSLLTSELLRLRKANIITDVVEDEKVYPKSLVQLDSVSCNTQASDNLKQEIDKLSKVTSKLSESCSLSLKCQESSVSWAPMAMGADFAEEIVTSEISKSKNPNVKSKTAVIDTGFDQKNQVSGLSTPIDVQPANSAIKELQYDDGGHGTPVASMISGKHTGVTKNVDLSLFKLTSDRDGSSSTARIAEAVEKACKQNNDVVNLSWGSESEERVEIDTKSQLWYEVARKQGCLIVQSAGNSGVRKKTGTRNSDLEDPHLTVEALDQFQEYAKFSTVGMVSAPGHRVFSLLSTHHKYGENTKTSMCTIDQNQHGKISGTSFSAPALAGVASQVVTILKARGIIPKDPALKIKLVKSILFAAQGYPEKRNGINAYSAALIARKVAGNKLDSSVEELKQIAQEESNKFCNQPIVKCDDKIQCSDKKSCVQDLRKRSFLCPASGDQLEALVTGLNDLKEKEMVMGLFSQIPEKELAENPKYKEIYSTDVFESILKESGSGESQYLLQKPVFKKNPKWKSWVNDYFEKSPQITDKVRLLQDEDVSHLPGWEKLVAENVSKAPASVEVIDIMEREDVRKIVDVNEVAKKVFASKNANLKIHFLTSKTNQKNPNWDRWVEDFLSDSKNSEFVIEFLTDRSILENDKWYDLVMKSWSAGYLLKNDRAALITNVNVQKKAQWPELIDKLFRENGPRLSFTLRDENVKKFPKWEEYVGKLMASEPDDYLLTDSKVKELPQWNSWAEKYVADPKNNLTVFFTDPDVQKHAQYSRWVEQKVNSTKDSFSMLSLLKNESIQTQPAWEKKIKEIFDASGESYVKARLLADSSIQKHAAWDGLLKKYLEGDKSDYKTTLLMEKKVLDKPEWGEWAAKILADTDESISINEVLKDEGVQKKPQWKALAQSYLQRKELEKDQSSFLTSANVMRKKEWSELSVGFIKNAENEADIVNFLKNDYVLESKDWKKLANAYLEKATDEHYKNMFLSSKGIAEKLK